MASKPINLKLDEEKIMDIKEVASVFHMTMTDVINEALDAYLPKMKSDPFFRLTASVRDASEAETEEILADLESLEDSDLEITTVKHFSV
jgi:hypothetical protein